MTSEEIAKKLVQASNMITSDFLPDEDAKEEKKPEEDNAFLPSPDKASEKKRKPRTPKDPPPPMRALFDAMCEFYVDTASSMMGLDTLQEALTLLDARESHSAKAKEEIETLVKAYQVFRRATMNSMKKVALLVKEIPNNAGSKK